MFINIAGIRKLFSLSFFCGIAREEEILGLEDCENLSPQVAWSVSPLSFPISERAQRETEKERRGGLIFWGVLCTVFFRDEEGSAPSVAVYNHSLAARETDPSPGGESVQAGPSFLRTRPGEAVWDCGTACQVQAPLRFHPQSVVFFLQSPHLRFIIAPEVHTSWRLSRPSSEAVLL